MPGTYAHILCVRLEGATRLAIAKQLNVSKQTEYRAFKTMLDRMKLLESEESPPV